MFPKKVPVIHQTDCFHHHADPDDHWDLASQFALAYTVVYCRFPAHCRQDCYDRRQDCRCGHPGNPAGIWLHAHRCHLRWQWPYQLVHSGIHTTVYLPRPGSWAVWSSYDKGTAWIVILHPLVYTLLFLPCANHKCTPAKITRGCKKTPPKKKSLRPWGLSDFLV